MKKYVASEFFSALDKIDSDMNQYTEKLSNVHSAIQGVVNLGDNLTGQGGEALKNFYANNHVPLLSYWMMACQQVKIATAKMRMNALSFESSDAVIDESFIEGEVIPQLETNQRRIEEHEHKINHIIASVSDIVSLPRLDTSAVQTGIHEAKQHAMNTVEKLYAFDHAQSAAVDQLISLIAPISSFVAGLNGAIESGVSITALAGYIASQDVPPEIKAMHPMLNGTYNVLNPYHHFQEQAVHTQNFLLSPNPFGFIHFSNPFIANVAQRFYLASGHIDVVHHYSPDQKIAGTVVDANGNEIASSAYSVDAEIINDWGDGHIEVRGGKVDYDALEEQGIIPNRFVTNSGHSIHYTDIDGELVIFMDDPDVHYYTNAHKQTGINYGLSHLSSWSTVFIGAHIGYTQALKKANGSKVIEEKKPPTVAGEAKNYVFGTSGLLAGVPIVTTPIPSSGSEERILWISTDEGQTWDTKIYVEVDKNGKATMTDYEDRTPEGPIGWLYEKTIKQWIGDS
ncbi:LXG domain-containing protein [Shouchella clausii]|uniref:LXG domain-containing protein n=1 Tax=Shouchella clausii TaxID=79880 RepID=UPI00289D711B|nr:LXG domain-containing protein [Shouchella clausii]